MSRIRWIHFSDLHLNLTGTEIKRLRKNLLWYLDTVVGKIDYAFNSRNFPLKFQSSYNDFELMKSRVR